MRVYIVLANGEVFSGKSFGASGVAEGEIVFTTAMTGYTETLTDPSYYGQIVVQTFPEIGNYGVTYADMESKKSYVRAYIVSNYCVDPSSFRMDADINKFLAENGIAGVYDVDTRALTKVIREYGVMNARITADPSDVKGLDKLSISDAVASVSANEVTKITPKNTKYRVALLDYGAKANIARSLVSRGCEVVNYPYNTSAEEILKGGYDGIMLSNGPGDPKDNPLSIVEIKKLLGKIPLFGICLGHQLTALAAGADTVKLKYGHRGANQPVKESATGRVYITSQNHGYAVDLDTLPDSAVLSHFNVNDLTCEGLSYPNLKAFTVQFHPEACAGPNDSNFLFDNFIALMEENICQKTNP